jgi:hypothetical protein
MLLRRREERGSTLPETVMCGTPGTALGGITTVVISAQATAWPGLTPFCKDAQLACAASVASDTKPVTLEIPVLDSYAPEATEVWRPTAGVNLKIIWCVRKSPTVTGQLAPDRSPAPTRTTADGESVPDNMISTAAGYTRCFTWLCSIRYGESSAGTGFSAAGPRVQDLLTLVAGYGPAVD